MDEVWKDIHSYDGLYKVSNLGRVKSFHYGKENILTPCIDRCGYLSAGLSINGKMKKYTVHRLVCLAFLDNPQNKLEINHKNGIKTDNRLENLEYCTASENRKHAYDNNLMIGARTGKFGSDNPSSKPVCRYSKTGEYIDEFSGASEAARITGLHRGHISDCCRGYLKSSGGYIWKYK